MKSAELLSRLKENLAALAQELEQGKAEGFLQVLEGMGRFHQYSLYNTMLILQQCPNATLVAGLKRWNELGRRVKKGEKGIAILAPILKRVEVEDGESGERVEERLAGFRVAYVFDISQTEGKPVQLGKDVPQGTEVYARLRAACPVEVQEMPLPARKMGSTDGKRIILSSFLSPTARAETLLHEWAHTLLHFGEEHRDAAVEELEAEAVAYAVGRELGLPMQGSRAYILAWQGTVEKLEESLERIMRAAREILGRLQAEEALGHGRSPYLGAQQRVAVG